MSSVRCLLLNGEEQEDFVLPCCVFFYSATCLYINQFGFIEECEMENQYIDIPSKAFPSRIVPLYVYDTMELFVDSWFNFYRMLWNSKWNCVSFLPAVTLMTLKKYAVQNDGFNVQTAVLIADKKYEEEVPHLIIKFI